MRRILPFLLVLSACASRTNVVDRAELAPARMENEFVYTPTDGRQCWTALEPGAAGPSDEELSRYGDPDVADVMPEVLEQTRPHMGASGVEHMSGRVVVSALVDPTGRVVQACLTESAESELDEVAIASVFQWRFKPATKAGIPVPFWVSIPFLFEGRP